MGANNETFLFWDEPGEFEFTFKKKSKGIFNLKIKEQLEALDNNSRSPIKEFEIFTKILQNVPQYFEKTTYVQKRKIEYVAFILIICCIYFDNMYNMFYRMSDFIFLHDTSMPNEKMDYQEILKQSERNLEEIKELKEKGIKLEEQADKANRDLSQTLDFLDDTEEYIQGLRKEQEARDQRYRDISSNINTTTASTEPNVDDTEEYQLREVDEETPEEFFARMDKKERPQPKTRKARHEDDLFRE